MKCADQLMSRSLFWCWSSNDLSIKFLNDFISTFLIFFFFKIPFLDLNTSLPRLEELLCWDLDLSSSPPHLTKFFKTIPFLLNFLSSCPMLKTPQVDAQRITPRQRPSLKKPTQPITLKVKRRAQRIYQISLTFINLIPINQLLILILKTHTFGLIVLSSMVSSPHLLSVFNLIFPSIQRRVT